MPISLQTLKGLGLPGPFDTFIETGYYKGVGVGMAIRTGFKSIYSIEVDHHLAERGRHRFKARKNITIITDSSPGGLKSISQVFRDHPCVFWLDAHEMKDDSKYCPLLDELEVIHEVIRSGGTDLHMVLIDDRRIIRTGSWKPVTEELLLQKLTAMFPRHSVRYLPGFVPEDIIAVIP